jgi:hypothetical protein
VRTLHPGYFALVMATGIVSISMHQHRAYALSVVLLWLACVAYIVLGVGQHGPRHRFSRRLRGRPEGSAPSIRDVHLCRPGTDVLGTRSAVDARYKVGVRPVDGRLAGVASCGCHFRVEYQTAEGEALRNDDQFAYVAAWEFTGAGRPRCCTPSTSNALRRDEARELPVNLTLRVWHQRAPDEKGAIVTCPVSEVSPEMSFLEVLDVLNEPLMVCDAILRRTAGPAPLQDEHVAAVAALMAPSMMSRQ